MWIIELKPVEPGVYNDNQSNYITAPPDGWAMIPDDFPVPSTYPRLGSIEAEELTYTREVEVQKEVTKTREVETFDDEGNPITVIEEYTEWETVTEEQEYTVMTVTAMTEGTLPDPEPIVPEPTIEERVTTLEESNAEMTEALDMILNGVTE